MSLRIEQHTKHQCRKTPKDSSNKSGVSLGEMLDFLTTVQAHGVPDGACVLITSGYDDYKKTIEVHWSEER